MKRLANLCHPSSGRSEDESDANLWPPWRTLPIDERIKCTNMDLIKYVQEKFVETKEFPSFAAGDTITVYYQIREGEKTRTQFFRGDVLQRSGSGTTETFTIRKMSGNIGVERIFPVNMPNLEKIEINKRGKVRRARIFYQRERTCKSARIKERRG